MSRKAHGQLRRGQVITTYGPGALIDLPTDAAIVAGLESWPRLGDLEEILEPRLAGKLRSMTGVKAPQLFAPPPAEDDPREPSKGIGAWRFPSWMVVQEASVEGARERSRRLVSRRALDEKGRFDGRPVVPSRFVRACPRGHVDDVDWRSFVHREEDACRLQLWLDERGAGGDLADLWVRCECGKSRNLYEATLAEMRPLGRCRGERPWLGLHSAEDCNQQARLMIRTASNAYFPQVVSVLSLPDRGGEVDEAVSSVWGVLSSMVQEAADLRVVKRDVKIAQALAAFSDEEVFEAIRKKKDGPGEEKPIKDVELDALLAAPEGLGDDVPVDPDFHARRLPDHVWRRGETSRGVAATYQVHRLREVLALVGFTRFEAVTPDMHGDYETDVERAQIALEPTWFPAVENRGEGVFVQLDRKAVADWRARPSVDRRIEALRSGHELWTKSRKSKAKREFYGGQYVLLHTLSHLLLQSIAVRCGYPAGSIRERIYCDPKEGRYGVLLYTGSPDADGTLGGLVQQARHLESHLEEALRSGALCSNDPVCAQHVPTDSPEERLLQGAACHGCSLVAETSCEMRNDYLDRALVVPTLGCSDAAFFGGVA